MINRKNLNIRNKAQREKKEPVYATNMGAGQICSKYQVFLLWYRICSVGGGGEERVLFRLIMCQVGFSFSFVEAKDKTGI